MNPVAGFIKLHFKERVFLWLSISTSIYLLTKLQLLECLGESKLSPSQNGISAKPTLAEGASSPSHGPVQLHSRFSKFGVLKKVLAVKIFANPVFQEEMHTVSPQCNVQCGSLPQRGFSEDLPCPFCVLELPFTAIAAVNLTP